MKNKVFSTAIDWEVVKNESVRYKWVALYRDHYEGNGAGEYFEAASFDLLLREQPYWFIDGERAVFKVELTNEDVPNIIATRKTLINKILRLEVKRGSVPIPSRPDCDGRATRRTQPEAFAAWDRMVEKGKKEVARLDIEIQQVERELQKLPTYSTRLLNITPQK